MKKIIFATGNEDKMKEIRKILADPSLEILSLKDAGIHADIDENGKITIRNSEEGSFLFFATVPKNRGSKDVFAYPRNNDRLVFNSVYSIAVALGRYDRNGFLMDLETLWAGVEKRGHYINAKPSGKHDDPLNVFAERNVKDR